MVVFLTAFALVAWQWRESVRQRGLLAESRSKERERATAAVKAQKQAEAIAGELDRELYSSDMIAIQQAWEAGDINRMGDLLDRHIPGPGQRDWRGFEWNVFQSFHDLALGQRAQYIAAERCPLGPGGDPGRSGRGRLGLRSRAQSGLCHPLGRRTRRGAANLLGPEEGGPRTIGAAAGSRSGRSSLRGGEPHRQARA